MTTANHQPDAGASLPARDLEDIARDLFAACGPFYGTPGMKLACAGRMWRVTYLMQPPPFPGEWLPCLGDDATAGILLAAVAELSDGPAGAECVQVLHSGGRPGLMWHVSAVRGTTLLGADHEQLGGAVALVLLALWGAS